MTSTAGAHGVSMAQMALMGCRGRWEGGVSPVSRVCRYTRPVASSTAPCVLLLGNTLLQSSIFLILILKHCASCRDLRAQRGWQVSMGSTGKRDLEGFLAPTETMASLVCRAKTGLTGQMERREATAQMASRARQAAMVPMVHTELTAPPRHLLQNENGVECWLGVGLDVTRSRNAACRGSTVPKQSEALCNRSAACVWVV